MEERRALLGHISGFPAEDYHSVELLGQELFPSSPASERGSGRSKRCAAILLTSGSLVTGLAAGFQMATSFLIQPVSATCSPYWSSSAAVYGASALAVGWTLSGPPSVLIRKAGLQLFAVVCLICCTSALLFAGTCVSFCIGDTSGAWQVLFIGSFTLFGFGADLAMRTMGEMLVHWFPRRSGLSGGVFDMGISVGSIVFGLVLLGFSQLVDSERLGANTMLFLTGFIVFTLMVLWIPFLEYPHGDVFPKLLSYQQDTYGRLISQLATKQMLIISFGFFANVFTGTAVFSSLARILSALWKSKDPPLMLLTLAVFGSCTIGRLTCLCLGDFIGLKRAWWISLTSQALVLFVLPWLMEGGPVWTQSAAIVTLCMYMFGYPAVKTLEVGLTYQIMGNKIGCTACGVLSVIAGPAGLLGPIAIEQTYSAFGTYKPFFIGTAVILLLASLSTACLHSLETTSNARSSGKK